MAARFVAVKLEAVVEPTVVEPVDNKLFVVRVPEIVVDAAFKELAAIFPAARFVTVVEAKVDDALTIKFCEFVVVAFVVEADNVVI